ncbi:hypothetical protein RND71_040177 [Anisodus tanguticus]|uniref:Uncharacterized protein n=1 Tax=Anisodus tanguticus TaxID=243964 RepID=A0AAE1QY78_9SOLA|nr:hypothetical protein RND71_040177 [Anisodus tanguticus]
MSTRPSRLPCPICYQIVRGYQEFMNHVQSHPVHQQNEIYGVEGSRRLSAPLSRPAEPMRHVRTRRNKRAKSQSPSPPPSFRSRWVRSNDSDKNVDVNQQLPPLPSYRIRSIRGNDNCRDVHTNQQLSPLPPSYRVSLVRGNEDKRGVHTNQQLPPPSSYRDDRDVHANRRQQMLQSTRRTHVRGSNSIDLNLNESTPEFARPHIKEINFPILDRSDPSQLKFKPQFICDDENSGVDLSLRL